MESEPSRGRWRRPLLWSGLALWFVVILGILAQRAATEVPPSIGPSPAFVLVDQAGQSVSSDALRGRVLLVDFIFTRCPDICPTMTARMAELQAELPHEPRGGLPIEMVSISVDPDYDRPAILAEYARRFRADEGRWHMLTGTRAEVDAVVAGYQQVVERVEPGDGQTEPDIMHGQRFVLVDDNGGIRGFYDTDEAGLNAIRQAAMELSRGGLVRTSPELGDQG